MLASASCVEQAKGSCEGRSGSKLLLQDLLTQQGHSPLSSLLEASEKRLAAAVMGAEDMEPPTGERDGAEVCLSCSREVHACLVRACGDLVQETGGRVIG